MANVSTRLSINVVPIPVLKMFTPRRCMPIAAAAISPNTAPDAPPVMPFASRTSTPNEPPSRLAA